MAIGNLFNEVWYLANNPDVKEAVEAGLTDAWTHFETYGKAEGRAPSPLFNPQEYLAANPDVRAAVEDGLITAYDHFLNHGASEGRSPLNLFDPDFYLSQNPDVAAAVEAGLITATEHFLLYGQNEPRQINPFINLQAYVAANPDLQDAVEAGNFSPLTHLLTYGAGEGRDLGNGINLGIFADDPKFQDAIESGDFQAALDRVAEVAPFLPSFQPPAGWTPPADTPIPVDFVPVEGEKLVIPPSVVVPDDVELPDTFEPVEPAPEPEPGPGPGPVRVFEATLEDGVISFVSKNLSGDVTVTLAESGENYIATFVRGTEQSAVTIAKDDLEGTTLEWGSVGVNAFKPGVGTVLALSSEEDVTAGKLSATIQGGVDASAEHGTVLVGPGTFSGDIDIRKDGVSIVLSSQAVVDGGFVVRSGVEGFNLSGDGTILNGLSGGIVAGSAGTGIYLQRDAHVTVEGITFEFMEPAAGQVRGIEAEGGDSVITVTGAIFNGAWQTGIYLNPGNSLEVTGSEFVGGVVGIGTDGPAKLVVKDSRFNTTLEGIGLTANKVIGEVDISGNNYADTPIAIANGGLDTELTELVGKYVVVVANGQNVQNAVDAFYLFAASTPDEEEIGQIILGVGAFTGDVKINGNLKLLGQGAEDSTVIGSIQINDPSDAGKTVSNIWLEGFTVNPTEAGVTPIIAKSNHDGIYNTKNLSITNVTIVTDDQHGLGLFDVDGATLSNLDIVWEGEGVGPFYAIEALGLKDALLEFITMSGGFAANSSHGALNVWWIEGYEGNANIELSGVSGAPDQTLWPVVESA